MMVQLMMRRHAASIKNNDLPTKVIITYKEREKSEDFRTRFNTSWWCLCISQHLTCHLHNLMSGNVIEGVVPGQMWSATKAFNVWSCRKDFNECYISNKQTKHVHRAIEYIAIDRGSHPLRSLSARAQPDDQVLKWTPTNPTNSRKISHGW